MPSVDRHVGTVHQPHRHQGGAGLAAAGFPHQCHALPGAQVQADTIENVRLALELPNSNVKILHRKDWIGVQRPSPNMLRNPSPTRLNASTTNRIASPGNTGNHHMSG